MKHKYYFNIETEYQFFSTLHYKGLCVKLIGYQSFSSKYNLSAFSNGLTAITLSQTKCVKHYYTYFHFMMIILKKVLK